MRVYLCMYVIIYVYNVEMSETNLSQYIMSEKN